jgi:hypothetical protein
LDSEKQRELAAAYDKKFNEQLQNAQMENWKKLHTALTHFSNKLTDGVYEEGKKMGEAKPQKLFDSMIEQAVDLCDVLTDMNITKDPALEKARQQLANAINGVTIEDLRKSEGTRALTKQKVDAVLSAFDWGDLNDDEGEDDESVG